MAEFLQSFPRDPAYGQLKSALNHYVKDVLKKAALKDDRPRFIRRGRINGQAEFVMDLGGAQPHERQIIEEFLGKILGGGQNRNVQVVVFGWNGRSQDFQLRRDDSGYVFRGNLIDLNIDRDGIKLWGYPDDGIPVFVLTAGAITR